ncbi:MAG: putative metal-binding motif-containing protein [Patescibacteria group bacterium]
MHNYLFIVLSFLFLTACNPETRDRDNDGYTADVDCNDHAAAIHPGHAENCDGLDNDCNGEVDDGLANCEAEVVTDCPEGLLFADHDGDGYGDPEEEYCSVDPPPNNVDTVRNRGDCDDEDASINPLAEEVCDEVDNDCDGFTDSDDEDIVDEVTWYPDRDSDGYGKDESPAFEPKVSCDQPVGYVESKTDCDNLDYRVNPAADEVCNDVDDDCDGTVDVDATDAETWYADDDDDGYGDHLTVTVACKAPLGYIAVNTDCNDSDGSIHPGAAEPCNGVDDDCDGSIDENSSSNLSTWYFDGDQDGYGGSLTVTACAQPAHYVVTSTDCNDGRNDIHPGASEYCDGADNDCDGSTDENAVDATTFYSDDDQDSFGDAASTHKACSQPTGYVLDKTDCNDAAASVHPGADEICDHVDNDCDSKIDDADPDVENQQTRWLDSDGDGFGDPLKLVLVCFPTSSQVANNDDCNDAKAAVNPDAEEVCNGYDEDCNGSVDGADASDATTWYRDADGDSYGKSSSYVDACQKPTGYVADSTDCNDLDDDIHPGASEVCDSLDNDCDGVKDEDPVDAPVWYADNDADGYGNLSNKVWECQKPAGYVESSTDCDDTNHASHPGAAEICDNEDNDCDGSVDEGLKRYLYRDADVDGYGNVNVKTFTCAWPAGYVTDSTDCNDQKPLVHPGAYERCNGIDDDCDGIVDENPQCDPQDTSVPQDTGDTDTDTDTTGTGDFTMKCVNPGGGYMDITVEKVPLANVRDLLTYSWSGSAWVLSKDESYTNNKYQVSLPLEDFYLMARLQDGRVVDVSLQDATSLTPVTCVPQYNNSGHYWYVWYSPIP